MENTESKNMENTESDVNIWKTRSLKYEKHGVDSTYGI